MTKVKFVVVFCLLGTMSSASYSQLATLTADLNGLRQLSQAKQAQWNLRAELAEAQRSLLDSLQGAANDPTCDTPDAFTTARAHTPGARDDNRELYRWVLRCKARSYRLNHEITVVWSQYFSLLFKHGLFPQADTEKLYDETSKALQAQAARMDDYLRTFPKSTYCNGKIDEEAAGRDSSSQLSQLDAALASDDAFEARRAYAAVLAAAIESRSRSELCPDRRYDEVAQLWLDTLQSVESKSLVRTATEINRAACSDLKTGFQLPEVCQGTSFSLDGEFALHQALVAQRAVK